MIEIGSFWYDKGMDYYYVCTGKDDEDYIMGQIGEDLYEYWSEDDFDHDLGISETTKSEIIKWKLKND
jgi:hypothetical protein